MSEQQFNIMNLIGRLLYRRMNDDLDVEDQLFLDNWINRQDHDRRFFINQITDEEEIEMALRTMYAIDEAAALADIQKKINGEIAPAIPMSQETEHPVRRLRPFYWAAAAAVILIIGTSILFYHTPKTTVDTPALSSTQRWKNEVAPGGDKAVLELADGSKIILDNASNGELAKQGHTKVIKLDNGQLAYHAGAATGAVTYNTISTPRGGQYQIVLPDGSKVWLNAGSSLRFPTAFTGAERRVMLSGEGYFQVAKHAALPFRVEVARPNASPLTVDVLGTEFNVMAYADEKDVRTTLVSGAVKVQAGNQEKVMGPGEQVRANQDNLSLLPNADVEEATAWKSGIFQFQDASIESIMRQVARWYDVDVVYGGKVQQQFIGKVPRQVNLTTMLQILESTGWVHFSVDGRTVTVSR